MQEPDEAFDWLWQQLRDMPFFRQNHYDVALPSHPLFEKLAKDGLDGADREAAHRVFVDEVYDRAAFRKGLTEMSVIATKLDPELAAFGRWSKAWGFFRPSHYEVVLTLYGPGGSYDVEQGRVTVLTTPSGDFRKRPLHNLVHEMVHIGIETPIVKRFGLSHPEKERLVDRICVVAFGDWLVGYRMQPMGPPEMDAFIDEAALADLPAAVQRSRAEHPIK